MVSNEPREGALISLVGNSVVLRIESGNPDLDDQITVTFSPAQALKLSAVLVRYAWRAAANARRASLR